MRKFLFAMPLLAALAGCATIATLEGTTVSPTQVVVAANAFDAVEATATNYLKLPLCPGAVVCRTVAGVKAIVPLIRSGRQARTAMEAYVTANPGQAVPVTLYDTTMTAVSALQSALAQYNAQ